jgi:uroporphyrinogen-III synthase
MTRRVLVTRAVDQAPPLVEALRDLGLEPFVVPAIDVRLEPAGGSLDRAARVLHRFDWVVVTSANGARAILAAAERVLTPLEVPRWAAVGPGSAGVLEHEGVEIEFRPAVSSASGLGVELPLRVGERVLLVRGDLADDALPARLRERGGEVVDVVGYRTHVAPEGSRRRLREVFEPCPPAVVVLTSGSTARGLLRLGDAEGLDVRSVPAVCVGPDTAREAERLGFEVLAVSPDPDPISLAATTAAAVAAPLVTR